MKEVSKAARKANGLSRMCNNCQFLKNCTSANWRCCTDSFIEGYKKGVRAAEKSIKESKTSKKLLSF